MRSFFAQRTTVTVSRAGTRYRQTGASRAHVSAALNWYVRASQSAVLASQSAVPRLLTSPQPLVSCGAYHQRTSSCSQHPRQRPPLPDLPLPLYHSTMHSPSPYTRHTRDLAFAGQMLMHSNAFKMKSKHTKLTHAKLVRRIAIAHTPCGRARRAHRSPRASLTCHLCAAGGSPRSAQVACRHLHDKLRRRGNT